MLEHYLQFAVQAGLTHPTCPPELTGSLRPLSVLTQESEVRHYLQQTDQGSELWASWRQLSLLLFSPPEQSHAFKPILKHGLKSIHPEQLELFRNLLLLLATQTQNQGLIKPCWAIYAWLLKHDRGFAPEYTWKLGWLARKLKKPRSALSYFQAIENQELKTLPTETLPVLAGDVAYALGRCFCDLKWWQEAQAVLKTALDQPHHQNPAKVHYFLALSLSHLPVQTEHPLDAQALACLHFEQAEQLFTQSQRPADVGRCAYQLGLLYQKQEQWIKALQAFENCMDKLPQKALFEKAEAAYHSGEIFFQLKKYNDALMLLQFAEQLYPPKMTFQRGMAALKLALVYLENTQVKPCYQWAEIAAERFEQCPEQKALLMAYDLLIELSRLQRQHEQVQIWKNKRAEQTQS